MYICVCLAIRENEVKETITAENVKDLSSLKEKCKAGTDCGSCLVKLQKLLNQQTQKNDHSC